MRKLIILALFLLIIPISLAQQNFINDEEVVMNVQISSNINLQKQRNAKIEYIEADLLYFPKEDYRQRIISRQVTPDAEIEEDTISFRWEDPEEDNLHFTTEFEVETFKQRTEISRKVPFPLENLPPSLIKYTQPSENIDSDDPEIIEQASKIAEGEDDLYKVVSKLAIWTENNIEYSLNSLTADVSRKSSWVLLNKFGVCDELTSLFIAMSRSLGIPARYVSGLAYTNFQDKNDWGPHAWAEVYFPEFGWLPVDITYRQIGFIDSSHIKLDGSLDSIKSSIEYKWKGFNFEPDFDQLNLETTLKERNKKLLKDVEVDLRAVKDSVNFGSYNLIEVELQNIRNHYVTTNIVMFKSKELEADEENQFVILGPKEKKTIYWKVKVDPSLDQNYIYTFPVSVSTSKNQTDLVKFKADSSAPFYSSREINSLLKSKTSEEEKIYSERLSFDCNLEKTQYFYHEKPAVSCRLENQGNTYLDGLQVCFDGNCEETDLGITQKRVFNFSLPLKEGFYEKRITVSNSEVSASDQIQYVMIESPSIEIKNLNYPSRVSYDAEFDITFNLEGQSNPQNVEVKLIHNNFEKSWTLNEFKPQTFSIKLNGRSLDFENSFEIIVTYEDSKGKEYSTEKKFNIQLVELNIMEKALIFLKNLF